MHDREPVDLYNLAQYWCSLFGGTDWRKWYVVGNDGITPIWYTKEYAEESKI